MNEKVIERYNSYVSRMWLDNCDENKAFGSTAYTHQEYKTKYSDYLWKRFIEDDGVVNGSNNK